MNRNNAGIIMIFILKFVVIVSIISYLYFGAEQIQRKIKERVCNKVIKQEDVLLEIAEKEWLEEILYFKETQTDIDSSIKYTYYKELKDERVDKVFEEFFLMRISKNWDESIVFEIRPTVVCALWDDYMYGFYYTETDEPIDVVWGKDMEENEFEAVMDIGKYWYRTEKITDHWWYYETKTLWLYPTAHRF